MFRSPDLRDLVRAAVDQDFELDDQGRHPKLICPVCGHPEIITTSGRMVGHEFQHKVTRLRRHGLFYRGRGGSHC